jgi:uncharacterized protein (TIGR00369 family)
MTEHESHLRQIPPAAVLLGRELLFADAEAGEVRLRYLARDDFANRHGTVQGGFLAAILDSATGAAVMAVLPPDLTAVTTRLDTSFVKPARLGPLLAAARVVRRDARSAEVEAEIMDDSGLILATAKAELRILPRKRSNSPQRP